MTPCFDLLARTGSSQGSHTSKYFGSIDSSENDHSRKQPAGGGSSSGGGDGGEEQFIKCVLQDPIWLLMANTDDKVMMTYQLPVRYDTAAVAQLLLMRPEWKLKCSVFYLLSSLKV